MHRLIVLLFAAWASITAPSVFAQAFDPLQSPSDFGSGIIGQFEQANGTLSTEPAQVSAHIVPATAERPAMLLINAKIAPGRYTYSITQPPGGPRPVRIDLTPSSDYRLLDTFRSHPAPESRVEQGPIWAGVEIQQHKGEVTWFAPIELAAGTDPASFAVTGKVHLEVCETGGSCIPLQEEIAPQVAQSTKLPPAIAEAISQSTVAQSAIESPQSTVGTYQSQSSSVKLTGRIVPGTVRPGETARLELTATLPPGGRIYAHAERDDRRGTKPVLIAIGRASGLLPQQATSQAPVKIDNSAPELGPMPYHEGTVTWTVPLRIPSSAPTGAYTVHGLLGHQACVYGSDGRNVCEMPQAVQFEGTIQVGEGSGNGAAPLRFAQGPPYSRVAAAAAAFADALDRQSGDGSPGTRGPQSPAVAQADSPSIGAADPYRLDLIEIASAEGSLAYFVALAFIGGVILNLMPCVLPVIGLKVMSFVEQAGKSRSHALVLNLWFALGIVSVFLLLGFLAALPQLGLSERGLGWGGQFGSTTFNVTLAAVVFAMALSLLGVWEVPIPGFFGSGSVQAVAAQEGYTGAFLKGVVTTVLATPCTAPFMAAAIAWAIAQPAGTTLTVFASLGIGMASPYLLIGVYPELLRFLPKPGAWMETFKQISGFVLLATVVFILSFIEPAALVPAITMLLGIGLACWFVARTPLTAGFRDRLQAWGSAAVIVVVFVAVSFGWLYRVATAPTDVAWQPFSLERLKQVAVEEGRTVLVDFSADWCLSCKVFEQTVLHTNPVKQAIARAGAVTLYGDYTDYPEEIDRTLKALGATGVPVIAIFPADAPYQPIVFRGGYTQQGLIGALQQATSRRQPTRAVADASAATPPLN